MIRLFSMFSGYGGAEFALKKSNIYFESVGFSEIDKYAIHIFINNHKINTNFGNCRFIQEESIPDFDLLTAGFPCQPFSNAGLKLGEQDVRGTLFYDIIRIAEVKQPKYILLENVKGLTQQKFKYTFDKILSELDRIGYNVRWKVLNSAEYGIPQNRRRVWFVCFRKDIDNSHFKWPEKEELKIFVKDILEKDIDAKYDLSDKQIKRVMESKDVQKMFSALNPDVAISQTARQFANWKGNYIQWDMSGKGYKSQQDRAYPVDGVMGTIPNANPSNKVNIFALRTRENGKQTEINDEQMSNALTSVQTDNLVMNTVSPCFGRQGSSNEFNSSNRILPKSCLQLRRLTPKECFRLMGFLNDEIDLTGFSDTQLYKLAGNGWEINVASKILKEMLKFDS